MIILKTIAASCSNTLFGIDSIYKYMPGDCNDLDFGKFGIGSIWLILAGLTDALLKIGAIVSVAFFIFGAFRMVTSQGSPEAVKSARTTMVNALVGLVISILGAWFIGFIIGSVFKI